VENHRRILLLILILFLASCHSWNWKPHAYQPHKETQAIYDAHGDIVYFTDDNIQNFVCFPDDNIAELAAEIENIKKRKYRRRMRKALRRFSVEVDSIRAVD